MNWRKWFAGQFKDEEQRYAAFSARFREEEYGRLAATARWKAMNEPAVEYMLLTLAEVFDETARGDESGNGEGS